MMIQVQYFVMYCCKCTELACWNHELCSHLTHAHSHIVIRVIDFSRHAQILAVVQHILIMAVVIYFGCV